MLRSLKLLILVIATLFSYVAFAVIPQPKSLNYNDGEFVVKTSTAISFSCEELRPIAAYMLDYLAVKSVGQQTPSSNYISVELQPGMAKEAYRLTVAEDGVRIVASDYGGAFYGVQTLFQMMPSEIYTKQMKLPVKVAFCEVEDAPQFAYRGFMLDVARTWVTTENVKLYIDRLSHHKINKLHWHLSDDQGWRVEIKSHPELTEQGGYRGGSSPVPPMYGKWHERYGGYYSQSEIREIVEYARVRNVEIIPEIDLPGHSWAFAAVHPEVLCNYQFDEGHLSGGLDTRNVFCASKESNYELLDEILAEVCALFPSEHIHIGGDEVSLSQWKKCPDCSAYLKRHGYTDAHKVEDYFIERLAHILKKYGKRPAVWNEGINGGGLDKSTRVHGWSNMKDCRKVLAAGYPTIFMPAEYFYFDMRQSKYEAGSNWSNIFDAKHTYSFDFADHGFSAEQVALVEGFEGAYWSEIALSQGGDKSIDFLEYMTFPRLCAVAELAWGKNGSDWDSFYSRLKGAHYDRMSAMGINYRLMPPKVEYKDGLLSASTDDGSKLYYQLEGSDKVNRYSRPIKCDNPEYYLFHSEYCNARSPQVAHADHYKTIKPTFTLTSSIESGRKDGYKRIEEYRSRVTTARTCRNGDWFLFEFEEPVKCRQMEFITGYTHIAHRVFPSGYLEISYDGKTFEKGAALVDGCAKIIRPSKAIKAVRIISTTDRNSTHGVVINAPVIRP
jgi:hexosaminidase